MVILHDQKLAILHIPKAGGSSVRRWLEAVPGVESPAEGHTHSTRSQMIPERKELAKYKFVAVMRSPVSRMESIYKHCMRTESRRQKLPEFGQFIVDLQYPKTLAGSLWSGYVVCWPQWRWLEDGVDVVPMHLNGSALREWLIANDVPADQLPETFPRENPSRSHICAWTADAADVFRALYGADLGIYYKLVGL